MKKGSSNKRMYSKKHTITPLCNLGINKEKRYRHIVGTINVREVKTINVESFKTIFVSDSQLNSLRKDVCINIEKLRSKIK